MNQRAEFFASPKGLSGGGGGGRGLLGDFWEVDETTVRWEGGGDVLWPGGCDGCTDVWLGGGRLVMTGSVLFFGLKIDDKV